MITVLPYIFVQLEDYILFSKVFDEFANWSLKHIYDLRLGCHNVQAKQLYPWEYKI